jgi:hypothetical protein
MRQHRRIRFRLQREALATALTVVQRRDAARAGFLRTWIAYLLVMGPRIITEQARKARKKAAVLVRASTRDYVEAWCAIMERGRA